MGFLICFQGSNNATRCLLRELRKSSERTCVFAAGRVHAISSVKLLGGFLLVWMSVDQSMWRNAPLVVSVYLLRTMANNSTYALQKSILMDFVPKVASSTPCNCC